MKRIKLIWALCLLILFFSHSSQNLSQLVISADLITFCPSHFRFNPRDFQARYWFGVSMFYISHRPCASNGFFGPGPFEPIRFLKEAFGFGGQK